MKRKKPQLKWTRRTQGTWTMPAPMLDAGEAEDAVLDWYERQQGKYTLIGFDGQPYNSAIKGTLGGHRQLKIYGRLDCPSALRFIAKGQYVKHRVFFLNEEDALGAGYRPCAKCLPEKYKEWKNA